MTTFMVYSADSRSYYPDQSNGKTYAFAPIAGNVQVRPGTDLVTGSTDESGEPVASILAPEGATLGESNCGDVCLYIPGDSSGITAHDAYQFAKASQFGLKLSN
jgi:hypothetical protein